METGNCSAQQRRILNLIWASAGDYGFEPLFMAFTTDKKPDYYMNCMVGFVHKWYGDEMPRRLFDSWAGDRRQSALDDLTWLALENAAYERELAERPALADLRRDHAQQFFDQEYLLSRQEWMAKNQLVYTMQSARWKEVLGQRPPLLSSREQQLHRELLCSGSLTATELEQAIRRLARTYLGFDGTVQSDSPFRKQLHRSLSPLLERAIPRKLVRTDNLKISPSLSGSDRDEAIPVTFAGGHIRLRSRASDQRDRQYIEACFGRSRFSAQDQLRMDQALCTGKHFGCHLWITDGAPSGQPLSAEVQTLMTQAAEQEQRNRQYYADCLDLHRNAVRRLTEQIHNCILIHQRTDADVTRRGRLDGSRVWREAILEDDRVFTRWNEEPHPCFTVDLLLDGSASRLRSQETIAAQGYILSQSLTQCGIPVRVSSFCSLRGYTVLRVLKDFGQRDSSPVFRYFASGWNRDGLALRGLGRLLEAAPSGQGHLIVLLTDASPSDSRKVPPTPDFPVSREYDGQTGIDDTADEIRVLRRRGIRVAAVFMGVNSSVPAAKQMFGKDLVRIQRMDQLATAAGQLIQTEIRELGC